MKADPKGVLTGSHKLSGNYACAEGALSAGCRFLGIYPIMPALEVSERYLERAPAVDATFIQMEDEVSVLAAVLGASWTGKRAMAVTSGPGLSLMMEHRGLGVMLETPCVIVDVQRIGPGLGMPNYPAQGDMMQARWGSHGDYEIIALAPSSPQEMFNYTIKAFNLAERYRSPVAVMADEYVAHLEEEVVIPPADEITIEPRRYFDGPTDKYLPFKRDKDLVPRMVDIGQGYRFHVTGLTHDDRGYPIMFEECQEYNVHPLVRKIRNFADDIVEVEEKDTEDAAIIVVSYGSTSRAAKKAMEQARTSGLKVGSLKLVTVWPFADKRVAALAKQAKAFVVPEMNFGQIVSEVERCSYGHANVFFVPHGEKGVENTEGILSAINKAAQETIIRDGVIEGV
ncbi:2-oxoglutarate ferredoxin oxidoreductase subunit alpha [candidate division WOR_3 bacterium SM23_60]|uniref:2-oxoglutarate ferredoxin oxidoreductase subunit alpha n=1 Tax=candidate division WOR_3 bacterium SM23_60 TaxID=1703780 RepID=A0A0S8G701_UNCW3|nr:MAG: 2-oxoglutarate ferredoxin oxidoreductase subunit alpha [candidate division WOR_3 bacterium SM23_60]